MFQRTFLDFASPEFKTLEKKRIPFQENGVLSTLTHILNEAIVLICRKQ